MQTLLAFFRLVRWQNLMFIVLTQVLFYFCISNSINNASYGIVNFVWLVIASVFIAAGGYIINDYFDLNIDQINKPSKNVINSLISRRWAIMWHFGLSSAGILATLFSVGLQRWYLIVANVACVLLLWLYSTSLKKRMLIGNFVVSILTAWTVLIIFFFKVPLGVAITGGEEAITRFFRITILYSAFAFIISLIREALKDIEDMEGDARYGCKTLPIVAGVVASKIYIGVWIIVLLAALLILQLYIMQFGWWWAIVYSVVFIIIPLTGLMFKLQKASYSVQFGYLSNIAKRLMLAGILSMVFFKVYF